MAHIDEVRAEAIAQSPEEARRLLLANDFSCIRLNWNISSDQFFKLAMQFKEEGVKMFRDERGFCLKRSAG